MLARAYDRGHLYALREAGVDWVVSETYHSALEAGRESLLALDVSVERAAHLVEAFDQAEAAGRDALYEQWRDKPDGERYGQGFQSLYIQLEAALRDLLQSESPRDTG